MWLSLTEALEFRNGERLEREGVVKNREGKGEMVLAAWLTQVSESLGREEKGWWSRREKHGVHRLSVIAETGESVRSSEIVAVASGNGYYTVCLGGEGKEIRNERWLGERGESKSRLVGATVNNYRITF